MLRARVPLITAVAVTFGVSSRVVRDVSGRIACACLAWLRRRRARARRSEGPKGLGRATARGVLIAAGPVAGRRRGGRTIHGFYASLL